MLKPTLVPATLADYPTIQNMGRFYLYDMSRYCGFISDEWNLPPDGLYECMNFKSYFEDPTREPYLVKVGDELAGFVLLDREGSSPQTQWNMGEFFILAKFQGKGIGADVARQIWQQHPGLWEVSVIPENKKPHQFWSQTISDFTNGHFTEETKVVEYDTFQPHRIIFSFDTNASNAKRDISIRPSQLCDIPRIVEMSYQKRRSYESSNPQFWKYAGPQAEDAQSMWFKELLTQGDHIMLTAERNNTIVGFIVGKLMPAPEVYSPGGLTLMIDDFCVENETAWDSIGFELIQEIRKISKTKEAVQILVVCGAHDEPKRKFLQKMNLIITSEWYVGEIV